MKFKLFFGLSCAVMLAFSSVAPASAQEAVPYAIEVLPRVELNDTFHYNQWYLESIRAYEAWAIAPASSTFEVVVAVIDSGMDDSHPDLKGALWVNTDEEVNGKDDDGNGFVDDIHGWNFVLDSSDTRPVSKDGYSEAWEHGTIVSSLIAARGNDNVGIAGMAWSAKIMPLIILDADGYGGTDKLASAIRYATQNRAHIINLSLEGSELDQDVADAILEATSQGVLVVIAAGNGFDEVGHNFADMQLFPACHEGAANQGLLVVSATAEDGSKYASANYGSCVSLSAPGDQIFTAKPSYDPDGNRQEVSGYGAWSGTSLSAPLVTGVAAMLKAKYPGWTGEQIARRITDTVQPFPFPAGSQGMGAGILDAYSALTYADPAVYGPWQLFASASGQSPTVWITDSSGNDLYTLQVGNPGDKRAIRASFVRWDEDRTPEVIVTSDTDTTGAWRVYRLDGVLVAAGQLSASASDIIKGGALISTQDITNSFWDHILFTEALGNRAWLATPESVNPDPIVLGESSPALGTMAVGLQRPGQSFVILRRGTDENRLYSLSLYAVNEGGDISTANPERLRMSHALSADNRELLRFVQSGEPSYMIESGGIMEMVDATKAEQINNITWRQAPLGEKITDMEGRLFYDSWPR